MPTDQETDLRKQLEAEHGEVLKTSELQAKYEVEAFAYGLVVVRRRSDGVRGAMQFSHSPRLYFDFVPTGS